MVSSLPRKTSLTPFRPNLASRKESGRTPVEQEKNWIYESGRMAGAQEIIDMLIKSSLGDSTV